MDIKQVQKFLRGVSGFWRHIAHVTVGGRRIAYYC